MELYKEIVNIEEFFFFKGLADLKYGAVHNRYLSEKFQEEHYAHRDYYDIEISSVEKFDSPEQFKKWTPKFQLNNIRNGFFVVHLDGQQYAVKADVLYIHESLYEDHVQVEGEDLHGDFSKVQVAFRMHKKSQMVRCIPNFPTGNVEYREDGTYKEYTTGEFESDGDTCSTYWSKESVKEPIKCPINQATGNRETKNNCIRLEYYTGRLNTDHTTCETYWGDWICNCKQDEWTGNEKELDGWIWREYYNSDCTTNWKQFSIIEPRKGCLSFLPFIIALVWAAFCCYWAVKYGSFMPILFGIGIPIFIAGLGYGLIFLGRFSKGIGRFFNWLMQLLLLFFLIFLLNGLFNFFSNLNWADGKLPIDTSWEQQEVLPQDQDGNEGVIDADDGRKLQRDKISIKLRWNDLEHNRYEGVYSIYKDDIAASSANLKELKTENLTSFTSVYANVYNTDKKYLGDVYSMLDSIRVKKKQNNFEFANTIVSMIQSIDYVLILEQSCNDPSLMRNNELRKMREQGIPCVGFAPYGIKTPSEFLSDLKGDCDTRTLLLYTIFKNYNYDVAIINSDYYGHSMLGLNIKNGVGAYKTLNGQKYFFWETTSKGFGLGQLPTENGNLNYWNIVLN